MTLSSDHHAEHQEQQEQHVQHQFDTPVELATLILPSHAAGRGLDQQDQVVLEAAHETVGNLHEQACISAVVDLTALCELVGVSEQKFIADLRMDVGAATENTGAEEDEEANYQKDDERQPLLEGQTRIPNVDRITISAEPFVQSLVDVLPTSAQRQENPKHRDETVVLAEATQTSSEGDPQHFCHDAFLLNFPGESTTNGALQDHFVLALAEILVDTSRTGPTVSERSDVQQHVPFLERAMSLLPNTTHLPTDVVDVHLEAHQEPAVAEKIDAEETKEELPPATLHLDLVVARQVPVIGYVILISGLVALSSVGAALDLQQGPSPAMKTLWRQAATCLALAPLVLQSLQQEGRPALSLQQWCLLPLTGAVYAYMTLAFVFALSWTTMANAFVLSNMASLVIIAGRVLLRRPVLPAEGLGAVIGFSGAAVCARGAAALDSNNNNITDDSVIMVGDNSKVMLGNVIALSASFGTAGYLLVAKDLRSKMNLFVFIFCVMLLGSCFLLCFIIFTGEEFTWGMHPVHGLWGWLNPTPDRLPLELYMALVCNCLGTTGYIAVMKYFEAVVPATVMLMEPVVGSLLGVVTGTASLPDLQTWIGNAVVATGTFIVIYSGSSKTEKIDATDALRPSNDDAAVAGILKSPLIRKNPPLRATKQQHTKIVWDHE